MKLKLNSQEFRIYEKVERSSSEYKKNWIISLFTIVPIIGIIYGFLEFIPFVKLGIIFPGIVGLALSTYYQLQGEKHKHTSGSNMWIGSIIIILIVKYFAVATRFAIFSTGGAIKTFKNFGLFLLNLGDQFNCFIFLDNLKWYFNEFYWVVSNRGRNGINLGGNPIIIGIIWIVEIGVIYYFLTSSLKESQGRPYDKKEKKFFIENFIYFTPKIDKLNEMDLNEIGADRLRSLLKSFQGGDYSFFDNYDDQDITYLPGVVINIHNNLDKNIEFPTYVLSVYTSKGSQDGYIKLGKFGYKRKGIKKDSIKIKGNEFYFNEYLKVSRGSLNKYNEYLKEEKENLG